MTDDLLNSLKSADLSKKITFLNEIPQSTTIEGDPFLIRQALANLIQNAVAFSPTKGKIIISSQKSDTRLEIRVEDEGSGVPSYALERVFEKFYSLQRPDTGRKSSGLGLSLVKEAASLHGGEARLENRPEGGARAILSLPLRPPF
jgi:two-component system sensor histidine kinase CreC